MPLRTIWRNKLLLAGLVAAIPIPLVFIGATRGLPTERIANTFLESSHQVLEDTYGPSIYDEYTKYLNTDDATTVTIPLGMPILGAFHAADAPAANDEMAWLAEQNSDIFAYYDDLATRGIAWDWISEDRPPQESFRVPNFLTIQIATKLRTGMAIDAAGDGNWDAAIEHATQAAHLSDPAQGSFLIGYLISVAGRSIAYGGFTRLLDEQPTTEQSRAAALRLNELAATDPRFTDALILAESGFMMRYLGSFEKREDVPKFVSGTYAEGMLLLQTLAAVGERSGEIADPDTRAWFRRNTDAQPEFANPIKALSITIPWTRFAVARKKLQDLAVEDPAFLAASPLAGTAADELPPEERIFLQRAMFYSNVSDMFTRSRTSMTYARLAQAAYAARVHRSETGAWPTSTDDLDPALFPPLPPGSNMVTPPEGSINEFMDNQTPYGPFHCAVLPVDNNLANAIIGHYLDYGIRSDSASGPSNLLLETREDGTRSLDVLRGVFAQEGQQQALAYVRQSLLGLPNGYVRQVDFLTPEGQDITDEQLIAWGSAQQATGWDRTFEASKRSFLPVPDYLREESAGDTTQPLPVATMRLRAEFPGEMFVLWSNGPDGDDDRAQTIYDPTNGAISNGDMIIFPGGL
ncbi:MAG: hypothetical protein PWP23_2504 [Candidatus Sumerlaeota bacterium]|nr:hypothetical protein [Candidatus Sumerlaeota bacterium]